MLELALLVAGVLLGGGLAWAVVRVRMATAVQGERENLQARVAALETLSDELRKQLSQRDLETGDLRRALEGEQAARAQAETRWEGARQSLDEQKQLLDDARERLTDTFRALSADALRQSQSSFLEMASAQLDQRREAIDGTVRPLHEALARYEEHVRALEAARQQAYGSLEQQLKTLAFNSAELQRETGQLATALRAPNVRGRWGEITLHRVVELAGLTEHCDYGEQVTVEGQGGRLRPDMVVRLPAGREIVVDAKVPLAAYLEAIGAATPEERAAGFARHATQVRQHMTALSGKAYWEQFATAPELVVMFIPGEAFVGAAVEADPSLIEDGMARRIVVATPTTLIALLRAIAYGWRQERIAANAAQISELGRQLYERLRTLGGHVEDVGSALGRAVHAYNSAVGSLESRVLPAARKFRDLGAAGGDDIEALSLLDQAPRPLTAPEYPQQLTTGEPAGPGGAVVS
ncbi:MAG TPA: DNA recombination protein RmuC [Methylomirabilota bacterium]|nr:DNA recombination protein RmuC [Methylomirabilota bacterium]